MGQHNVGVADAASIRLHLPQQWPQSLIEPVRKKAVGILGLGRIGRSMVIRSGSCRHRLRVSLPASVDPRQFISPRIQTIPDHWYPSDAILGLDVR